jgi:CRP-like cAMP-binding protein
MRPPASAQNAFLSELSADEFSSVGRYLAPLVLRAGAFLHRAGDQVQNVIFPHSGLIAVTMPGTAHAAVMAGLAGRDTLLGGIDAAAAGPANANAEVHIDGRAFVMPAAAYRDVLDANPSLRRRASRFNSISLAQAQQSALCHAMHSVEARFCRLLLEVRDRTASRNIPLLQSVVARMLGVRRTTVTLVAGALESAGLIRCHRGYLEIADAEQVQRHACPCYAHMRSHAAKLFGRPADAEPIGQEGRAAITAEPMGHVTQPAAGSRIRRSLDQTGP